MQKVILNKGPGMIHFPREIVNAVWDLHPELFSEPLDMEYLVTGRSLEEQYAWAVER